jgi:hypothetical protein
VVQFEDDRIGPSPVEPVEVQTGSKPADDIAKAIYATAVKALSGRGIDDMEFVLHQDSGNGRGTLIASLRVVGSFTLTKKES